MKTDQIDILHGVSVPDPYRWLEDNDAPETRRFIDEQNARTQAFLADVSIRPRIRARLEKLWDFEKWGLPVKRGGRYFFNHNDGLRNQSVLYVQEGIEGEPRVLLDPNTLSADGTVALAQTSTNRDGTRIAYATSSGGSDWNEWHVRDVDTGADLSDHLVWVKFSGAAWSPDGSGFYYSRYDEPTGDQLQQANYHQKVFFHRIGTPQSEDRLVYERPDQKKWGFGASVTEDGRYLILQGWRGTHRENAVLYRDLSEPESDVVELLVDWDAAYVFLGNEGTVFFFQTDLDCERSRVIAIDITEPGRDAWREVIAEHAEDNLRAASFVGGHLVANYLRHARSVVRVHSLEGDLVREVVLPGIGTAEGFLGRQDDPETFYAFTGFDSPPEVQRYDVATGVGTRFRKPELDLDPADFVTQQVFVTSRDGTRVPAFVFHRKGLELDGNRPTYLYGYGGFNIPLTPAFSVANTVWSEMGGVVVIANLRGGGEYGESWHRAGSKLTKQNTFDDFIAVAEWLVAEGYTRKERLAIGGGSNGGLLVGACLTQRPDLFGACLPDVGVFDMLRFHKFTIGWAWTSDYGSPDDPEEFAALIAYSPLHNVRAGTAYPPTLICTGDHDDRVVPAHSFKFVAALQEAQEGADPVLIRVETRAGHGAGKPTDKVLDQIADKWAFLAKVFAMAFD